MTTDLAVIRDRHAARVADRGCSCARSEPIPCETAQLLALCAALASPAPASGEALDVEHAASAHYAQTVDCGDAACPLNWRTLSDPDAP